MKKATVYSPGHISTIFQPKWYGVADETGSRGTGITTEEGVTTDVTLNGGNNHIVFCNDHEYKSLPTYEVIDRLRDVLQGRSISIRHKTNLPFGSGNGNSAAMTLNTSFGLCKLLNFDPGHSKTFLRMGHEIEVMLRTGLGDIGPMFYGTGIDFRKEPGLRGYQNMVSLQYPDSSLLCFYLGQIDTQKVLRGNTQSITRSAESELKKLSEDPCFDTFIECSKRFAKDSNLIPERLERILSHFDRASMIMLGNSGFVFGSDVEYEKLLSLGVSKKQIIRTKVTQQGTKVIE